ncbi:MAG: mechanosensitive ion channel family protein [Chromatiales bacterium]|jgi:small-conductance mechanosensitive channel
MDALYDALTRLEGLMLLGNSMRDWVLALLAFAATAVGVRLLLRLAAKRLAPLAARTRTAVDDTAVEVIRQTKWWVLTALGVFAGSRLLALPDRISGVIAGVAAVAIIVQGGIWVSAVVNASIERSRQRQLARSPAGVTTLNAIGFVSRIVIWAVVVLLALDNLGVDVTALVAGLGVGGVAVALAVQNILGDLFASLSIVFDKPFAVGDFLIIDSHMGAVEQVGLKTTRIRSLSGEQLVFSNSDLLKSRIRNYGRMYERRVVFNIGVTYQTPRAKLERIPGMIREAIEAQAKTRFDRSHFKEYGSFSLTFETVYYVLAPDYNLYMDIQQAVNLSIHERFEEQEIEFAYPTQTLFVKAEA